MAVSHRERLTLPAKGVFRQLLPRKPPYSVGGPSLGHTGYERPETDIAALTQAGLSPGPPKTQSGTVSNRLEAGYDCDSP